MVDAKNLPPPTFHDSVIEANIEFPLQVLSCAAERGIKKYMTIDTCLPEGFSMYSFAKKRFNDFGRYYAANYGMDFYNMILEMFYGHDEPSDRFIPSLIRKMLSGDEVNTTLGTQHRDIIAADDVIQAIMIVLNSGLKGYAEIPVGTGIAPTISELVDFIWEETGRKSKVNKGVIPMRSNEPDCAADIKILESLGDYKPVAWKTGIKEMIRKIREGSKGDAE